MGMEFDARCDDGYVTCLAAMSLCYVLSGNAAGNGDVTCDNNVLRLYEGNVACLAAMPLVDVLCYVLSGNAADESDAACFAVMPLMMFAFALGLFWSSSVRAL